MNITLTPDVERFLKVRAEGAGYRDAGDYVAELIHHDWKQELARSLGIEDAAALAREAGEGYADRSDRDLEVAREWAALDAADSGEAHE